MDLFGKAMSLLFNMLSSLVITFLPRSKRLLISWLQSPCAVILESRKIKSATVSPSICHEVMGLEPGSQFSECWALSQLFDSPLSLSSRDSSSSSISAIRVVSLCIWGYWYFSQQSWFQLVLHPAWNLAWCTLHIS